MNQASLALNIGKQLVELCRRGKHLEAVNTLYSDSVTSVEPIAIAPMPAVAEGIHAVRQKNKWWTENHDVHGGDLKGPFPHGDDRFACYFSYDVTHKPSGQRMQMEEVALYTVKNDKIQKEEFFYCMGG